MNMLARYGTILLLPSEGPATEDVRALLKLHDVEAKDATPESGERYAGIHRPAIIIAGRIYEGVREIASGLNYHLRF